MASKKVGGASNGDAATKSEEKQEKGRKVFSSKNAVDAEGTSILDEAGKLTAVPVQVKNEGGEVTYDGFHYRKHKPLTKADFAGTDVYMDYRAFSLRQRIDAMVVLATKYTTQATNLRKFGDEKTRKAVARVHKLREQMAALEAELAADGVDYE